MQADAPRRTPGWLWAQSQRDQSLVARSFERASSEPLLILTASLLARTPEDRPALERDRRVTLTSRGDAKQIQRTRLIPLWSVAAVTRRTTAVHANHLPAIERRHT